MKIHKTIIWRGLYFLFLLMIFAQCHGVDRNTALPTRRQPEDTMEKVDSVSGQFREDYRVVQLSEAVQRLLFVINKADSYLPENGFYLHLTTADAKRLGASDILIIPLFPEMENIFYDYNKNFSFEIIAVPGLKDCYYTKNIDFFNAHNTDKILQPPPRYPASIFDRPTLKDTIEWSAFNDYRDLREVPLWIDNLDNQKQVTVHYIGCAETTNGGHAIHDYRPLAIAELAKARLNYLRNTMQTLGAPQGDATKQQWQAWLDKILNSHPENQLTKAENRLWTHTLTENSDAMYALDQAKNEMIRLHPQPEYTNFKDQQVIAIHPTDSLFRTATIASSAQPNARAFIDFIAIDGSLYTINKQFQWGHYSAEPTKNKKTLFYQERSSKKLLSTAANDFIMDCSYMTDTYSYILYHQDKTTDYQVLCLHSKTGEIIAQKKLERILTAAGIPNGKVAYLPLGQKEQASSDFAMLLQSGGKTYHIRVDQQLVAAETVLMQDAMPSYPHYLQIGKRSFYIDKADNELLFYPVHSMGEIPPLKLEQQVYDRYLLIADDDNFRLFYEYADEYTHGIKTILINSSTFKPIGKAETVYSYVQLESESSENTPTNLNAFKIGKKWMVSFMLEQQLIVVEK